MIENLMDYFIIQLILCNGRRLIKNFPNLGKNNDENHPASKLLAKKIDEDRDLLKRL